MVRNVDIIIVNWNSGELTFEAIAPYINFKNEQISCNVIVVNNGSTDNSIALLQTKVPDLIINPENLGFGKACNQAFLKCTGEYILLLNPDTNSDPKVLTELVVFLEKNNDFAVTGPRQVGEGQMILRSCGRFPNFANSVFEITGLSKFLPSLFEPAPVMTDWDHSESKVVDHVMGSYMLIRKSVLDKIGFMDDAFFVYFEDIDLSKRIKDAGFKIYYHSDVSIFHKGGGTGEKHRSLRLYYSLHSRFYYWKKYFGEIEKLILILLSFTVEPLLRIVELILRKKGITFKEILVAYQMYFKDLIKSI